MKLAPALPKTMQAAVYHGIDDIRVETVPVPRIGSHELLVRVAACGVCPTDIKKIQYGTVSPPRIFGHETAGIIVQTGAHVQKWKVGDRVALHHHVPCLKCYACRHRAYAQCPQYKRTGITAGFEPAGGGYAEYVRVMSFVLPGVVKIPRGNRFEEGAMLEPVNTVLKGVNRLGLMTGDTVLVVGQGPIGLIFTRLLALKGMKVAVSDLLPDRLDQARRWGARKAFQADDPEFAKQAGRFTRGRGFDGVVLAVPSAKALDQGQTLLRGGGRLLLFAHTHRGEKTGIDLATVCVDEKDLVGSYSADFDLQRQVARWVFRRHLAVEQLITHTFSLHKAPEAIAMAASPVANALKIMVFPERRSA